MFKKFNDHEINSSNTRLIGVYDDWEGFRVIIENVDDNSITRIGFDEVKSYKVTDESYKLNLPNLLNPIGKVIYFTNASDFIAEFHKESLDIYINEDIFHYLVVTSDEIVEVICNEPPNVKEL